MDTAHQVEHVSGTNAKNPRAEPERVESEMSLADLVKMLGGGASKRLLVWSTIFAAIVAAAVGAVFFLRGPVSFLVSLNVNMEFDGAARGRYPSGEPFSFEDVVSPVVLEKVYAAKKLETNMKFDEFKSRIILTRESDALNNEVATIKARLADPKLTEIERTEMLKQYQLKREVLTAGYFTLAFDRSGKFNDVSPTSADDVLRSVLRTWADVAAREKGAFQYPIPVYSKAVLNTADLASGEIVETLDVLKGTVHDELGMIDRLSALPGVSNFRLEDDNVSLSEIRVNLERIQSNKLMMLFASTLDAGQDRASSEVYLQEQIQRVGLDRDEAKQRLLAGEHSLWVYLNKHPGQTNDGLAETSRAQNGVQPAPPTPMSRIGFTPQIGDAVFERLLTSIEDKQDAQFRQKIATLANEEGNRIANLDRTEKEYTILLKQLQSHEKPTARSEDEQRQLKTQALAQVERVVRDISKAIGQVNAIYCHICKENFNPASALFSAGPAEIMIEPFMSLSRVFAYSALTFVVIMMIAIAAIILNQMAAGLPKSLKAENNRIASSL